MTTRERGHFFMGDKRETGKQCIMQCEGLLIA